jgi:hypothetical protein
MLHIGNKRDFSGYDRKNVKIELNVNNMMINFGNNDGIKKSNADLSKSEYRKTTTEVNKTRQNVDNQANKQLFERTKITYVTAQFGTSKNKYITKTIEVVREVEESKEVSRFGSVSNNAEKKSPSPTKLFNELDKNLSNDFDSSPDSKSKSLIRKDYQINNMVRMTSKKIEDNYEYVQNLGQGGYGKVIKVKTKNTNEIRA